MFPHLTFVTIAVLFPAPDPELATKIRAGIKAAKAAAELVNGIQDATTAETAKPKLDEYTKRLMNVENLLARRRVYDFSLAEMKAYQEYGKANEELAVAHDRIFAQQKPLYKLLATSDLFKHVETRLEKQAAERCAFLHRGALAYSTKSGRYPLALRTLVEGGTKMLQDPWGAPYHSALVDVNGQQSFTVWTFSPYGDGKKKIESPAPRKK